MISMEDQSLENDSVRAATCSCQASGEQSTGCLSVSLQQPSMFCSLVGASLRVETLSRSRAAHLKHGWHSYRACCTVSADREAMPILRCLSDDSNMHTRMPNVGVQDSTALDRRLGGRASLAKPRHMPGLLRRVTHPGQGKLQS